MRCPNLLLCLSFRDPFNLWDLLGQRHQDALVKLRQKAFNLSNAKLVIDDKKKVLALHPDVLIGMR